MTLLHRPPFKTLYILYEVLSTLLFRVPYWLVYLTPKSNRPVPTWSLSRCIFVYGLRRYFRLSYATGGLVDSPNHLAIREGKGVHAVWVKSTPEFVKGSIRERADKLGVEYVKIPGYWFIKEGDKYDENYRPTAQDKVIYTTHGGGFSVYSAHPSDPLSPIRQGILDNAPDSVKRLFSIEYRISSLNVKERRSTHPFPTALVDAIAGYSYLIHDMGYTPENIIFEGDSAGANLTLALARYLVDNNIPEIPPPSGLIINCPWADLSLSHITPGSSCLPLIHKDIMPISVTGPGNSWYSIRAYVGMEEEELMATKTDPYISPACLDIPKVHFDNFPKTLIVVGTVDSWLDATKTLYARMKEDMGDRVELCEIPSGVHDFQCLVQFDPERKLSFRIINEWITRL